MPETIVFRKMDYGIILALLMVVGAGWTLLERILNSMEQTDAKIALETAAFRADLKEFREAIDRDRERIQTELAEIRHYLLECPREPKS